MTIQQLLNKCYKQAEESGWHKKEILIPEQVALICSEACEALESYRSNEPLVYVGIDTNGNLKPCGVIVEYADVVIRIAHYVELLSKETNIAYNFDLIIQDKLAYNKKRGYRHGNKKC